MSSKKSRNPFKALKKYLPLRASTDHVAGPPGFRAEPQSQANPQDSVALPDKDHRVLQTTIHDERGGDPGLLPPDTSVTGVAPYRAAESANESTENRTCDVEEDGGDLAVAPSDKFGALKAILEATSAAPADPKEAVTISNKIKNLLPRLITLEDHFDTLPDDVGDFRRRNKLIGKLEDLEEQLRSLHEGQGIQPRFKGGEDVYNVLEDMQEAIYEYQNTYQITARVEQCKLMSPDEESVLGNFRCAQDADYLCGGRKGCLRGTRRALLDEIEIWTRDFDKPSVYWLNGLAGTGKSTIAQTIAERLSADGRLGASFFCSRDFEDRSDLHFIFPTLAAQLAQKHSNSRSEFVPLVKSDREIVRESLCDQMYKLIVLPLAKFTISTVIVIDALDECKDDEPASAILSVLGRFMSQIPKVKFFLTGRPEPRIREGFSLPRLAEATNVFFLHEVKPSEVKKDIRALFQHEFSELAHRRRGLDDWPSEVQLNLLCERAAGLFVYAMATIRVICDQNADPRTQLNDLLQSPGSSVLEGKTKFSAQKTLDSLYLSVLQKAFGDDYPERDPKIRSILGAVVLAANPLSPSTIATLLGLTTEGVFLPLLSAHSLLILQDNSSCPVRPFHKSFPDFIIDPGRCANPRFHVFPPKHHMELLVGCLNLLNQKLERNMCNLPDAVTNSEVVDLKERTQKYIGQALEYACKSWHKHLPKTTLAESDITSALYQFMEKKFLFWLEVLSILGTAREAVVALEAVAKLLNASPTLNLVNDCFRFVVAFFEVIDTSAPHIYHSALLLSPQTSIAHDLYKQYCCPFVRVLQGSSTSWEQVVATRNSSGSIQTAVWSPCMRFIAFSEAFPHRVEILDAATLTRIQTLAPSLNVIKWLDFSPDGCLLTGFGPKLELHIWDLQTGHLVNATSSETHKTGRKCLSSTYSLDIKTIAVAHGSLLHPSNHFPTTISTYDLTSGMCIFSHSPSEGCIVGQIWAHNRHLQFSTVKPGHITIWEADFTSIHTLAEVKTMPGPDEIDHAGEFLFLHTLSRLAFTLKHAVRIWDAQDSKLLLDFEGVLQPSTMVFSHDGQLFMCATSGSMVHVKLVFSPNAKSILMQHEQEIQLRYTKDPTFSLSDLPAKPFSHCHYILDFSPDGTLAAVALWCGEMITILDLECGEPRLTINTGMEIFGLRVTGGTILIVGEGMVATWNVPAGGCAFGARADMNDSVETRLFDYTKLPGTRPPYASISPDLNCIAITGRGMTCPLDIYDISTGKHLVGIDTLEFGWA
ncbi:hypothetical protein BJ322DRAFT_1208238 [Thelephora terrestris]|uniref:NACHT domain-containing protein n=1 Tax=Thelephora terrestris TaxID=56493 RepID=A0A9P6LAL9_9AGAM|nr:hypothetical protein BJ322DRAFT_1208238 [Thelephora terrestris]